MGRNWSVEVYLPDFIDSLRQRYSSECGYLSFDESIIKNMLTSIKVDDIEIIRGTNVYWSGILFLEPWDELEERLDWSEEEIIDCIIQKHIRIEDDYIRFIDNRASEIQFLFDKYEDGYGMNIPANIETIINRMLNALKEIVSNDPEFYGDWVEYN